MAILHEVGVGEPVGQVLYVAPELWQPRERRREYLRASIPQSSGGGGGAVARGVRQFSLFKIKCGWMRPSSRNETSGGRMDSVALQSPEKKAPEH